MDGLIFFCGPHTAGKTTILKTLKAENFFVEIGLEIGKELYYKRKLVTSEQGADFEFEVTNLELERDKKFLHTAGLVGVESWHVGNLAYATLRNPAIVDELAEKMKTSPLINFAKGIYLDVPCEKIFERTKTFADNRQWAAEFYSKINGFIPQCLEKLGLEKNFVKVDASRNFNSVINEVKLQISKML